MVVDASGGKQGGDWHAVGRGCAVGEDDDGNFLIHRFFHLVAEFVDTRFESVSPGGNVPSAVEDMGGIAVLGEVGDLLQLMFEKDRGIQGNGFAVVGAFIEEVPFGA